MGGLVKTLLLMLLMYCVADSLVCGAEVSDGVNWHKTRAGSFDIQSCPPSLTGLQSCLLLITHTSLQLYLCRIQE